MTMEPLAYETRSIQVQGLLFIGLLVGLVFAEVFCSGRLSDWLITRLAHKNNSQRIPEMRLWLGYPAAVVSSVGLVLWGISVDKNWHWMTGQVAFFLCEYRSKGCRRPSINSQTDAAGTQVGNTVLSTYIVDNYPEFAMEVIMFYSVVINVSST